MSQPQADLSMPAAMPGRVARVRLTVGLGLCLFIGTAATLLIVNHSTLINGSSFWRWNYRPRPLGVEWSLLTALLVGGAIAIGLKLANRRRIGASLATITAAAAILRVATAWLFWQRDAREYVGYVVWHPVIGSYYTVAEAIGGRPAMLAHFHEWMAAMPLHAMNKPPGLVLFNLLFIRAFGHDKLVTAPLVGLACGALSLLCVPLLYWLVRVLDGDRRAGLCAAALWAVCPGAAIFFPLFDPLLTVPVLMMTIAWVLAMRTGRYRWSAAMGATLAVTLFFTFNVLPIGAFLAAAGLLAAPGKFRDRSQRFVRHASVVAGVFVALHASLALATGYSFVGTLRAALANQATLLAMIPRPYPDTIWWDLIDYALGVAWLPVVLAGSYLTRASPRTRLVDGVIIAGLLQLALTAVTALLPGETARVWNFLIPLLLLPAALELARWPAWAATVVYGAMAFLTALLSSWLVFMYA